MKEGLEVVMVVRQLGLQQEASQLGGHLLGSGVHGPGGVGRSGCSGQVAQAWAGRWVEQEWVLAVDAHKEMAPLGGVTRGGGVAPPVPYTLASVAAGGKQQGVVVGVERVDNAM